MRERPVLVTGFEPYGGRGLNPAHEAATALDGETVAGVPVVGRGLGVSLAPLRGSVADLLDELEPRAVISLGLWPGEPVLRLERVGLNLASFEIPDNAGLTVTDAPLSASGSAARFATLPLRAIERAMLAAGIPVRLSSTAGTYLCNACLYAFLEALEARALRAPCGFIHLPYVPQQVAEALAAAARQGRSEPVDLASMELSRILAGVRLAIETTLHELAAGRA
jgi:pyroglutamyl-peptidase